MIDQLGKQHDDWIRIAYGMTGDMEKAKDLVQDMYVKVLEKVNIDKIKYGDQINRYFVWKVLRSLFIDGVRKAKSRKHISHTDIVYTDKVSVHQEEYDEEEGEAFEAIMDKINKITSEWHPYDKRLFGLYFMSGHSLRQIAHGAGLGLSKIHSEIKAYREIMREHLSEDLMDYFNGDYDKIN